MWTLFAVVVSAGLYYVSTGLGDFWPAAWMAPVPVLLVAFSRRRSAVAAFAAYLLGSLNLFSYLTRVLPVPLVLVLLALPALVFAAIVLLARAAVARLPAWIAPFAFPVAWTAYEFLLSLVSPHGTALSLAYSQMACLPVVQIASLTGIWGITFLVALIPCTIATAWARRDAVAVVPAVIIGLAVLGYGFGRLRQHPQTPEVRVGLAATDRGVFPAFRTEDPTLALAVAHAYAERVARLAARGAQVVILPEKFVGVTPADADAVEQVFSEAARAGRAIVIAGFNYSTLKPPRNQAAVFALDGRAILKYEKHHMLPGPETGYAIGSAPGLFAGPAAQWGVAICKDLDFQTWSRQYGRLGVRILAVPAWDFIVDARLHSRMAVLRGVEEGFTIARSAQQGNLTFSDAYGRILAEQSSSQQPDALLVANIPPGPGATLYTRLGDWFGWLCVLALIGFVLVLLRRRILVPMPSNAGTLAVLLLALTLPTAAQLSQNTPELIRVNPHVYCATGYALGNVIFVITSTSVVVVDTTEGQTPASAALGDFRRISTLPVSYIIYTHHHGDHIHGARVFAGPSTKIVAQKNHIEELRKYRLTLGYNMRLNQIQWGAHVPRQERGATLGVDLLHPQESGYIPPQVTFDEEHKFSEGGTRFELYHTLGETVDHLMVWLPDLETLLPGDLFYWSFPMLASPGKPDRPVLEWAASLDRMRQLHPAYLVGSHSRPLTGRDTIGQALANYARAIRYVHDATVQRMNAGEPLWQIRGEVRLPADLASLPYLQPVYGTIPWAVNGVFRQYTGWYDFDPAHLNAGDPAPLARALAQAAGGTAAILDRARQAQADGQLQLALELAETAITADNNAGAHRLRMELLEHLAAQSDNGVVRNIDREAAAAERKAIQ